MKKNVAIALCALMLITMVTGALAETTNGNLIAFEDQQITSESGGVTIEGTTVTITEPGTYTLMGSCSQGQVIVDTTSNVTLELSGLTLTNANGPSSTSEMLNWSRFRWPLALKAHCRMARRTPV